MMIQNPDEERRLIAAEQAAELNRTFSAKNQQLKRIRENLKAAVEAENELRKRLEAERGTFTDWVSEDENDTKVGVDHWRISANWTNSETELSNVPRGTYNPKA